MAIFSAFGLIRVVALYHLTLAYYVLTNPSKLVSHNMVLLLGEAMHLPAASSFSATNPATGFLGVVFALLGLIDLTSSALPDRIAYDYWGAQTPIRLVFLFGLTGYIYLSGGQSTFPNLVSSSGDALKNGFIFTWSFTTLVLWFWIFVTLRDEMRSRAARRSNST